MNLFSSIKEALDDYYGNTTTYKNGLEKFFKQYAGLILGLFSIFFAWELNAVGGVILAVLALYICKFMQSNVLKLIGAVCCGVTICLFVLWLLL